MRRLLNRSMLQRSVLSLLVMLMAFGPITGAFAAGEAEPEATEAAIVAGDGATAEATEVEQAEVTTTAEEPAPEPEPEPSGTQEATTQAPDDTATTQAPGADEPYTPVPGQSPEPSNNGNGGGGSSRPCGGCVGNSDDKNPPGQLPGPGDDGNNGYECDDNSGGGKTNPAHSGCKPAVSIDKGPDNQIVDPNGTATWTITVTNTGQVDLTGVTVADAKAPACNKTIGNLARGASTTYQCSLAGITADLVNVAVVTTTQGVTDNDDAAVVVRQGTAKLAISKSPNDQTVASGGTATWTIRVTNAGPVPLTNVTVVDPKAPACDRPNLGSLAVGASAEYTCTLADVTASFVNVATADSTETGPVSDDANVVVPEPGLPDISIAKTPDVQTVASGGTATWTITVRNIGNEALTNVVVTDPRAPNCDRVVGALPIDGTHSYECSLANVTAAFTNVATVDSDQTGPKSDDAVVNLADPQADVSIQKNPDDQLVERGGPAEWTITVRNEKNRPLTGVVVDDPLAPDCDRNIGNLAVGEARTYDCSLDNIQEGFTNTAIVSTNETPDRQDTARVTLIPEAPRPSILLRKSASVQPGAVAGDRVTYQFEIINNGETTLTDVTLNDPKVGGNVPIMTTTLEVDGVTRQSGTVTYTLTQADIEAGKVRNTATVTGTSPQGEEVTSTAKADVDLEGAKIQLKKDGPDKAKVGTVIEYQFEVVNTGFVTLTNVTVTDPMLSLITPVSPSTLAPGDVGHATAEYTVTEADLKRAPLTNTATATGRTPQGRTVEDDDDHITELRIRPPKMPPGIRLDKSGPRRAEVGDVVTYTFTATNTGKVTLTDVRITDALLNLDGVNVRPSTLEPGESGTATATYRITAADGEVGRVLNTAIVTGQPPMLIPPVRDRDKHEITIVTLIPPIDRERDLPATGAASTGYALTALLSLMLGTLFLRVAGSPAAGPSHFAQVLRGPDANSLHMMLRRMGLAPKPGGRQLR